MFLFPVDSRLCLVSSAVASQLSTIGGHLNFVATKAMLQRYKQTVTVGCRIQYLNQQNIIKYKP
jgi:hypothetical protein